MRLDRLITLGLISPLHRAARRLRAFGVRSATGAPVLPILMYHSISDDPEPGVSPYYRVCTSPRRFAEHMQCLADRGCRGVTLSEGLAWLAAAGHQSQVQGHKSVIETTGDHQPSTCDVRPGTCDSQRRTSDLRPATADASPAAQPVALTFDDGFRDFHTEAFPVLRQHDFSATMYLPTAFVGDRRRSFLSRECLTWQDVAELSSAGVEFGSHTVHHPKLVELAWAKIETELAESKKTLEQRLNKPVHAFSYPYAFPQAESDFAHRFRCILHKNDYHTCVTTVVGRGTRYSDLLQLPRLPANSSDDRPSLIGKLTGDYDWIAIFQRMKKRLKRNHGPTITRVL